MEFRKDLDKRPSYDVVEKLWRIKINANECNLNLPPLVEERVMSRFSSVAFNRYPNEEYDSLRDQIAKNFGVYREQIVIGAGSSEIIEKIFYIFGGNPNNKIVYPTPSFSMYKIYAQAAECDSIPFKLNEDFSLDIQKFIETVNDSHANLAVVCNPNNPTGNGMKIDQIKILAENIKCPLLIDEAYIEFYGETASGLLKDFPNLMIARTFSKAYGLAGARVGYLITSKEIAAMVERAYMPYHMNVLSIVTADIVYQMRSEFVPRIQMMIAERKRMASQLQKLPGFKVFPSVTNFLLVRYPFAKELNRRFEERGIGVRSFGNAPELENCLRISMGMREENDIWFDVAETFSDEISTQHPELDTEGMDL